MTELRPSPHSVDTRMHFVLSLMLLLPALLIGLLPRTGRAEVPFARAATLEMHGEYAPAAQEYETYLSLHPGDRLAPLAAMSAANIYSLALGDRTRAIKNYERVVKDYPESSWGAEAARRMAECLALDKRWAEAGAAYRQALELAGTQSVSPATDWVNEVSLAAAESFAQAGDPAQVITAYEAALQHSLPPQAAATVLYNLAGVYESAGQEQKAAERFARIIQEYPFAPAFDQTMPKRALIERWVNLDWAPYVTYAQTAQDFATRDYAAAIRNSDQVLAVSTNDALRRCAEYRKIVAEAYSNGDFTAGAQRLNALLSNLPDPRAMPNAQRQLEQMQVFAAAEENARAHPQDAAAWRALGAQYLQSGIASRAVEVLEKAKSLAPESADGRLYLGYAYTVAGRSAEAQAEFQFYVERNPTDVTVLNMIGYNYLGVGDPQAALPYFERCVQYAPDDPNTHDSLGEGLLRAGRVREAVQEYERAIALDSTFVNSHFMLGEVYLQLGDRPKAVAAYERSLRLGLAAQQAAQAQAALDTLRQE